MKSSWLLPLIMGLALGLPGRAEGGDSPAQIPVPAGWFSPEPDHWSAPDGRLSLCWEVAPLKIQPEEAARQAMSRFPGRLEGAWEVQKLHGETAWHWTGDFQGRRHRVVFSSHRDRSLILVFSFAPQQGFAMAACLDEVLRGFRWVGDQGK